MIEVDIELPDDFLCDEVRDGFLVKQKMKEVWAIELDLLNKFISVCKKYNLNYFAESGTLLGAVRHNGFIPWDDDVDVVMYREDYKKLCQIASKEFTYPLFFQTEETDPGSIRGHAQLRNSLTTGMLKEDFEKKHTFNQGIFIDIFPMDKLPNVGEEGDYFNRLRYLKNRSWDFAQKYHRSGNYGEVNPYYQELEVLCEKYNDSSDSLRIGTLQFSLDRPDMIRKIDDYKDYRIIKFEFLEIRIPDGYERVLVEQYKNWRELAEAKSGHGSIIFDTNKSYKKYLEERYE